MFAGSCPTSCRERGCTALPSLWAAACVPAAATCAGSRTSAPARRGRRARAGPIRRPADSRSPARWDRPASLPVRCARPRPARSRAPPHARRAARCCGHPRPGAPKSLPCRNPWPRHCIRRSCSSGASAGTARCRAPQSPSTPADGRTAPTSPVVPECGLALAPGPASRSGSSAGKAYLRRSIWPAGTSIMVPLTLTEA